MTGIISIAGQICTKLLSPFAVTNIRQRFILAFLHPTIPSFEPFQTLNLLSTLDIVLDVVVGEILATFVADSSGVPSGAPFRAVNLEHAETIAGRCFWASDQLCVQSTLTLHQADPVAYQAPRDSSTL